MDIITKARRLGRPFERLKVLFVAPEAAPFVKAGGLGEVMFSLPKALSEIGVDARIMLPYYAGIDKEKFPAAMEFEGLHIPTDCENENEPKFLVCNIKKYVPPPECKKSPVTAYFLENKEYYELRSNIYGYADDAVRWALLSRGTLEFLRLTPDWIPDIIFASDWQSAFLPNYLQTAYKHDPRLQKIATVFAIHNLFYQGTFDHHFVSEMDYDDGRSAIPSFFDPRLLKLNMMRRGIMYADLVSTVSPTYAKEIMTAQYGELLDALLKERRSRLYGVLNGIDYSLFSPETNVNLKENYDAKGLAEKAENKLELQGRLGLRENRGVFTLGIVARLVEQKGFDLLFPVIEHLLRELGIQLAVLGTGEAKYMAFLQELEQKLPGQVAAHLVFDSALPHLFYAGCDAILIPSKFEPSGLTQMEAMRYGCVPIARKTGGLKDSVEDYDPKNNRGTGFVFEAFDSLALAVAVTRAFEIYRNPQAWREIQRRCMEKDFSWKNSAEEYRRLFDVALNFRRRTLEE